MSEKDFVLHCKNTTIKGQAERITELTNQLAQKDAIIAEYEDEALLTGYLDKIEAKDAEIERLKQYIDEALDKISPGWADAVKEPKQ